MANPTKTNIKPVAIFVYNDTTDKYVAWDGNVSASFDTVEELLRAVAGPIRVKWDAFENTYVESGFGAGQLETVTYKTGGLNGTTVAVTYLAYDSNNRLKSGYTEYI